jgi:STE24 endopeptidase
MASERPTDSPASPGRSDHAKAYNRITLLSGIISSGLSFALLVVLTATGATRTLATWCSAAVPSAYLAALLFTACLGVFQGILTFPFGWYRGFRVEHAFGLSNQSILRWLGERAKALMVSAPLMAVVVCILVFCLRTYGSAWWLPAGIVVTIFSVVLARLAPVLIMPIFYRFTPIGNGTLKDRILRLSDQANVRIDGIFSFDLSKNTKKANAAFTGIGKAKRIILGDTLVKEFSEEEIETVFAHELGHYRFRHIRTGIIVRTVLTFVGLLVTARLYDWSVQAFGFRSITDLAAFPLLAIWLSLFRLVTAPLGNVISRRHERQADAYAVTSTGKPAAFASALRKLAAMNLADPEPHPAVEFLFYSHPPIARRLAAIEHSER